MALIMVSSSRMGIFSKRAAPSETQPDMTADLKGPTLKQETKQAAKRFDRAIWWVHNRETVKRAGVVLLIVFEAVIGLVGLWKFVDYLLVDYTREQALVNTFFDGAEILHATAESQAPTDLVLRAPVTLASGDVYDVVAFVENNNDVWLAQLTYHFMYGGRESEPETVVLLQGETVPVVAFGVESPRPSNPAFVVDSVEWWRIDQKEIPYPIAWKEERLNLKTMGDPVHDNDIKIGTKTFGRTTFTLKNASGFGYYEVDLYVVLRRGGALVGINRTVLSNVLPLEQRSVQVNWFEQVPSATDIELYPRVYLFDETVYRPESPEIPVHLRDTVIRR